MQCLFYERNSVAQGCGSAGPDRKGAHYGICDDGLEPGDLLFFGQKAT